MAAPFSARRHFGVRNIIQGVELPGYGFYGRVARTRAGGTELAGRRYSSMVESSGLDVVPFNDDEFTARTP